MITIADAQRMVGEWCTSRALDDVPIFNKLLFLIVEVCEAVQEMKHEDNPSMSKIGIELADVLVYLLDVSNRLGINLEGYFNSKMAILKKRGKQHRHSKLSFEG